MTDALRNTSFVGGELFFHLVKAVALEISESLLMNGQNFACCICHKIMSPMNGMCLWNRQTCVMATLLREMFVSRSNFMQLRNRQLRLSDVA